MRAWVAAVALTGVFGYVVRLAVGQNEKSAVSGALRFLASLLIVVAVVSPFLSPFPERLTLSEEFFSGETVNANLLLTEKSLAHVTETVKSAFPDVNFRLEAETDEDGALLGIRLFSQAEEAHLLADFIQVKYQIPCTAKER